MLTVDLVRARRKAGKLVPSYLVGDARDRLLPVARFYLDTHATMIGEPREEIEAVISTLDVPARDRVAALGLQKVIEDGCEFEVGEGVNPEDLRHEVFWAGARAHRSLDLRAEFDREAVLAEVASRLGTTPSAIDAALYADLRGREILRRMVPLSPEIAIERYNLGLAQAILLRATRVELHLEGEEPKTYRRIFRAARFHQLLHVVRRVGAGYSITLDGPFSLFASVQRYGFRLALFLPAVLACTSFSMKADILWGKAREPMVFEIDPSHGLVSQASVASDSSPDLDLFCAAFDRLSSEWKVRGSDRLFALPGEVVCVPDLVFESSVTGEEVYLEAFGFWSRPAVWQRIELLRKGFPCRILLAVGKQLCVSEEALGEDDAGEIYVFKATLSPRAVLERLRGGNA